MEKQTRTAPHPPAKGDDAPRGGAHTATLPAVSSRSLLLIITATLLVLGLAAVFALRQPPHPDMTRRVAAWDLADPGWWAWPLERNAFKRNVIRGNLRDIAGVPHTSLLWAVGEGGLILHSSDGGESWVQQHPLPRARPAATTSWNLIGSAYAALPPSKGPPGNQAPDVQQVIAPQAAEQNKLPPDPKYVRPLSSSSAVASKQPEPVAPAVEPPTPVEADPAKADLNAVYFSDAQHGWAVGNGGAVLATSDGGSSWRATSGAGGGDLQGVVFSADGKNGWAFPQRGAELISSDGGNTWGSVRALESFMQLERMARESGRSWGVPKRGLALQRDGGKERWLIDGRRLLKATSGAPSVPFAEWPNFQPIALQISEDGQRLMLVGTKGQIRYSRDGGSHWEEAALGREGNLQGLQCDDTLAHCVAVGDDGGVALAEDLANWRRVTPGTAANLQWARFSDNGEDGDAVSSAGIQYATHDGGISWSSIGESKLSAGEVGTAFKFVDGNFQWAVGPGGVAERSDDGGKSWRKSTTGSTAWLTGVYFLADHQRGWIAASDGRILATRDGGASWQPQTTPTRNWLWHISMAPDGKQGRALGAYGSVLLTEDGGVHWRESAIYSRYPAPWFWLMLLLGGILLTVLVPRYLRSRNVAPDAVEEGPASSLNSDRPITRLTEDRLGYRPAIEALANFLRNAATEPRITIAISGPWGSGKSSMMRMLETEMRDKGYRTAWFNAWHHQQEGRQLTALFNTVRRQGVPGFFRQPVAALRVRSRLIWGRSAFYQVVCIAIPLTALVAIGDFSRQPDHWERFKSWLAHSTLQWERTVVTDKSIEKLRPVAARLPAAQSAPVAEASAPAADSTSREYVRPAVFNYMRNALVWESGLKRHCGDRRAVADDARCVFKQPEQLLVTIEKGTGLTLWPSEREAILKASEQVPLQPLFPALEHFLVPFAGLLALLFTKGVTVYGMEMLKPLRGLLGGGQSNDNSKEPAGSIEHYRHEYCLLTEALDGRLLVFIDDIDRCNAETVNGIMELTNYLVDVGRCFVVLGMAMDRVKACIRPQDMKVDEGYADQYLRKLVHIELPVPIANARESLALFVQHAGAALKGEKAKQEERRRWLAQLWAIVHPWLRRLLIFVLLITAISLAVSAGRVLNNYRQPPALNIAPVQEVVASKPGGDASAGGLQGPSIELGASQPVQSGDVGMDVAASMRMPWALLGVLGGLLVLGLAIGSSRVLQERVTLALGGAMRTRDSDAFRLALETWIDAVRMHDDTPRGIKRFCNRARLFSLYEKQDAEALQREGHDLVPTADVHIVALAAIHHVSPEALAALVTAGNLEGALVGNSPRDAALRTCAAAHVARFGWPDAAAIQRFIERVERIAVR
jgi:photosystem II stability/assembly factor-like uncharacterized protein